MYHESTDFKGAEPLITLSCEVVWLVRWLWNRFWVYTRYIFSSDSHYSVYAYYIDYTNTESSLRKHNTDSVGLQKQRNIKILRTIFDQNHRSSAAIQNPTDQIVYQSYATVLHETQTAWHAPYTIYLCITLLRHPWGTSSAITSSETTTRCGVQGTQHSYTDTPQNTFYAPSLIVLVMVYIDYTNTGSSLIKQNTDSVGLQKQRNIKIIREIFDQNHRSSAAIHNPTDRIVYCICIIKISLLVITCY